uniref:Uncharacterized protein n=1 Tax=Amphimedon queenslandica TaxID=400682 RepID=A0A1X7UZ64_AMPQE
MLKLICCILSKHSRNCQAFISCQREKCCVRRLPVAVKIYLNRRRVSLSLSKKKSEERFTVVEDDELEVASGVVPLNTKINNTWAAQNLNDWSMSRNSCLPDDPVPPMFFHPAMLTICVNGCVSLSWKRVKSQASTIHHPHCMSLSVAYITSVDSMESS